MVLKSLNQAVKQTGDNKKMGCSFHTSRDNRRFYIIKYALAYRYSHLNWHTFLCYHTLIFQHSATYTCLHPRSQENDGYTRTPTRTSTGTHIHTYTQSRVKYEALVECYWETCEFLPFGLAVKCISQIKWHQWHMSGLTD